MYRICIVVLACWLLVACGGAGAGHAPACRTATQHPDRGSADSDRCAAHRDTRAANPHAAATYINAHGGAHPDVDSGAYGNAGAADANT